MYILVPLVWKGNPGMAIQVKCGGHNMMMW
jgi:hypothetical protein